MICGVNNTIQPRIKKEMKITMHSREMETKWIKKHILMKRSETNEKNIQEKKKTKARRLPYCEVKLITNTSTNCQIDIEKDEIVFFCRTSRALRHTYSAAILFALSMFPFPHSDEILIFPSNSFVCVQREQTKSKQFNEWIRIWGPSKRCTFPMSVRIHIDFYQPSSQYYIYNTSIYFPASIYFLYMPEWIANFFTCFQFFFGAERWSLYSVCNNRLKWWPLPYFFSSIFRKNLSHRPFYEDYGAWLVTFLQGRFLLQPQSLLHDTISNK